jgi:hypothetical protein
MANGNPNFELVERPALERFYAPLVSALEDFAVHHNLQLDKYHKHTSNWQFEFRHPAGGTASIQVMKFSEDSLLLAGFWTITDFDAFTRRVWAAEHRIVPRDGASLTAALNRSLSEILARQVQDTTPDGVDYRPSWRAEFVPSMRESQLRLPLPIP